MSEVRVVLLDLMDTLVRDPYHRMLANLPADMARRDLFRWKDQSAFQAFERGEIDEPEFFRRYYRTDTPEEWRARLPRPEKFKKELLRSVDFITGMDEVLRDVYQDPRTRVGLASNYSRWYHDILRLRPEIEPQTDYLFFSCELGVRKPDGGYYHKIFEGLRRDLPDLMPEHVLFLDDRETNVAGARAAGWQAALFGEGTNDPAGNSAAARADIERFLAG